jgi:hypothetical protein
VTREIGFERFFFLAGDDVFLADFAADLAADFFADFLATAGPLLALFFAGLDFLAALRCAPALLVDARFFDVGRLAPFFFVVLLPDFARDVLAFFMAIVLLLGVGDEMPPRIAGFGR